jgi:hypothetical protein
VSLKVLKSCEHCSRNVLYVSCICVSMETKESHLNLPSSFDLKKISLVEQQTDCYCDIHDWFAVTLLNTWKILSK